MLLALLLRIAKSRTALDILDAHAGTERRAVGAHDILVGEFEHEPVLRLLAPLDELALEVVVLPGHLIKLDVPAYDTLLEESVAICIATVEIYRAYQCLEGVARDEAVMRMIDMRRLYEFDQPYLLGYAVEAATLHNLATYRGEEALPLASEVMV